MQARPRATTTQQASAVGRAVEAAEERARRGDMTQTALKNLIADSPFKYVPVFTKYFGEDWDLISRIATDPAHEFQNLVLDLLDLICNEGKMKLKDKYWEEEKKQGRFRDFPKKNRVVQAPWHASKQVKNILTVLIRDGKFKTASAWPAVMPYFGEGHNKIKIAESLAFCGDRGAYFLSHLDIEPTLREHFVELLVVSGELLAKYMTGNKQTANPSFFQLHQLYM
jgi:hypothetical protein